MLWLSSRVTLEIRDCSDGVFGVSNSWSMDSSSTIWIVGQSPSMRKSAACVFCGSTEEAVWKSDISMLAMSARRPSHVWHAERMRIHRDNAIGFMVGFMSIGNRFICLACCVKKSS